MKIKQTFILFTILFTGLIYNSCSKSKNSPASTVDKPVTPPVTSDTLKISVPPPTWQEHWFEHDLLVKRVYYDNNLALYYDDHMSRSITWPYKTLSAAWAYVKKTYGNFGDSTKLYVVFHQVIDGKLSGGHPSTYFDASHDYRNTIDCGLDDWTTPTGQVIGIPIHEMGHIVDGASHGVHGSPSDVLWGDSKFMEIFIYDVYLHIGFNDEAAQLYSDMQNQYDDFPAANTQWFKNWFFPIYNKYGKAELLNTYFELLAKYYPKNGKDFDHDLNWGEFVHFWSGAAGTNLKAQATTAFGWNDEWEAQFKKAQTDFLQVTYK